MRDGRRQRVFPRDSGAQRGEGKGTVIFWLLVLVVGVLVGKQVVPVQIAKMELKDYAEELCQLSPRGTADEYRRQIFRKAKDLRLPVEPKDIKVEKNLRRAVIEINFPVVIDLFVTEYTWNIEIFLDRDIFLM